jgi:hypothetical protein
MAQYDMVIRNGLIVDGTGGVPYVGDVAARASQRWENSTATAGVKLTRGAWW